MKTSKANAKWKGNLKEGTGSVKLPTISQELSFSFRSRFENGEGTNPEELIAAAHAGVFPWRYRVYWQTMAFSQNRSLRKQKLQLIKKVTVWVLRKVN